MKRLNRVVAGAGRWIRKNIFVSIIFVLAAIVHLGVIFFNGAHVCVKGVCGLYIGGLHFHDALWHLALANSAFNSWPFTLPIFAGVPLQGYNYFLDLIIFLLTRLGIPAIVSYFKLIPIVTLGLLFILLYRYLRNINRSQLFIVAALFFLFFGSSFSYLLSFYHMHTLASYFYAQAMQSGRMFLNLQYAVSLVPFFGVLILLQRKRKGMRETLFIGLLVALTAALKIYGGIVILFLVLTDFLLTFVRNHEWKRWITGSLVAGGMFLVAILLFYNPFQSAKTGSIFTFSPFALSRTMIEAQDMFYMPRLVLARYYLQSVSPHSPRLLAIELFSVALFIFYNFGTRLVGLVYILVQAARKKIRKDEMTLFLTVIFSGCLTLLLVQKGDWWNVIQFFGYTLLIMNYFAGSALYALIRSGKIPLVALAILVVIFTLPTNIEQVRFAFERQATIPDTKLQVLSKLKSLPSGVVLALPLQDTSYVSALSDKPLYVADKGVLNIIGIDGTGRIAEQKGLKLPPEVTYVYVEKKEFHDVIPVASGTAPLAENADAVLFRVR